MKNKLIATSIIAASALMLSGTALANSHQSNHAWNQHPNSWYGEFNLGTNLYYIAAFDSSSGSTEHHGFQGWGWSGAIGRQFSGNWGVELGFMQNYAKFKDDSGDFAKAHTNIPYLAARYSLPIKQRASFIAKLGVMYASAAAGFDSTDHASSPSLTLPFIGLGFGYAITPNIDATVQYQGIVLGIAGAGLFSAGITYHFV